MELNEEGVMNDTNNLMREIAKSLDQILNPDGERKIGFGLFVFPMDGPEGARTNWVSNADRRDMVCSLKEIVARFEGQPEIVGNA